MKLRFLGIMFVSLSLAVSANASLKAEVLLGGSYGGQLSYKKAGVTYTMTNSGVPVGMFLGYKGAKGFYSGLEYTYVGTGYARVVSPSTHTDVPTTQHYVGVKLGYEGTRFRLFATYAPSNTLYFYRKASSQTNTPDAFYGSSAVGAGVGVNLGARWALDLSYFSDTFSTFDYGSSKGQSINGTSTFNNVTNTNMMLNLVFKL